MSGILGFEDHPIISGGAYLFEKTGQALASHTFQVAAIALAGLAVTAREKSPVRNLIDGFIRKGTYGVMALTGLSLYQGDVAAKVLTLSICVLGLTALKLRDDKEQNERLPGELRADIDALTKERTNLEEKIEERDNELLQLAIDFTTQIDITSQLQNRVSQLEQMREKLLAWNAKSQNKIEEQERKNSELVELLKKKIEAPPKTFAELDKQAQTYLQNQLPVVASSISLSAPAMHSSGQFEIE